MQTKPSIEKNQSEIVVALDFPEPQQATEFVKQLDPNLCKVKVGKELFTLAGPQLVESIQKQGFDVFLDLKFHDIPNTTAQAVKAAASLGVWMVNVHATGGRAMLEASANALSEFQQKPILIAVTVLTSFSQPEFDQLAYKNTIENQVELLAQLTKESGLDGVVCSAQEAQHLKQLCGQDFVLVTPGIRPAGSAADDQARIVTPQQAQQNGSDYLVIGRPIREHQQPLEALQTIYNQLRQS